MTSDRRGVAQVVKGTRARIGQTLGRLRDLERRTRPGDPEVRAALDARWQELPPHVRTRGQMLGRKFTGCEGTHGVFPACNFGCRPCYHAANANRVPVDGSHTVAAVEEQMAYLRKRRGPGQYAQLIGGEVSLLPPQAHAEALEMMRRHERFPMSFTHGDFNYDYLEQVAVRPDGTPRFDILSFAVHIDSTMLGRRGAKSPGSEAELHGARRRFVAMFDRLEQEHGVRAHLAHNMTVTPGNLAKVAEVVGVCRELGFRMCSFQPAAHIGDERRWDAGYRTLTDDAVWAEVERGTGTRLPFDALQVGDTRCNRVTWGLWAGGRYVPVLDDADPRDLRARDAFLRMLPGNLLFAPKALAAIRGLRALVSRPGDLPAVAAWVWRYAARLGPGLLRGVHPATYVMHSFIDAADVGPAWALLQRGITAEDSRIRVAQERLQACAYGMAHPELDQIVPACVQHSVLDARENADLIQLLPPPGSGGNPCSSVRSPARPA